MTPTREEVIRVARKAGAFLELSTTPEKDMAFLLRFAQHFYEAGAAAAREPLTAEIERLKKDCKLYAGMLAYGTDVVFPRGEDTTDEEAMAAIDAKSAELNQAHGIGSKK